MRPTRVRGLGEVVQEQSEGAQSAAEVFDAAGVGSGGPRCGDGAMVVLGGGADRVAVAAQPHRHTRGDHGGQGVVSFEQAAVGLDEDVGVVGQAQHAGSVDGYASVAAGASAVRADRVRFG
jgi:hypothetical protein